MQKKLFLVLFATLLIIRPVSCINLISDETTTLTHPDSFIHLDDDEIISIYSEDSEDSEETPLKIRTFSAKTWLETSKYILISLKSFLESNPLELEISPTLSADYKEKKLAEIQITLEKIENLKRECAKNLDTILVSVGPEDSKEPSTIVRLAENALTLPDCFR
ncbi:hypothetical protein KAW80_03810 [Candidatus Babeliales bacterium]|nr:hypothetical protein [Candidatus Babeliales bacterium]